MKKTLSILFISAFLLTNLTGCDWFNNEEPVELETEKTDRTENLPIANTPEEFAFNALIVLQTKDIDTLAALIHPEKGVRFSPYGYVNTDTDLIFDTNTIVSSFRDNEILEWGAYDGTGLPINLTFADYMDEFVYDVNFNGQSEVGVNEILGTGNTLINIDEVYPEAEFVEYYFPGEDEELTGMDWASLRIVMEKFEGEWKIVGIIHDEWTI